MNNITIRGYLRDKEYSHTIGDVEYERANLICPGIKGREDDIVSLRYKKLSCKYEEGDFIDIVGNLRSYSTRNDTKNTVEIYVFTYFDTPETFDNNNIIIDGRICKIGELRKSKSGKDYLHFTLANNIIIRDLKKINNYIPCTAYGDLARLMSTLSVNDKVEINGEFHSHTYKKVNENGEIEFKIAHEVVVKEYTEVE